MSRAHACAKPAVQRRHRPGAGTGGVGARGRRVGSANNGGESARGTDGERTGLCTDGGRGGGSWSKKPGGMRRPVGERGVGNVVGRRRCRKLLRIFAMAMAAQSATFELEMADNMRQAGAGAAFNAVRR